MSSPPRSSRIRQTASRSMTDDLTTQPPKPFLYKTANRGLAAALMALGFELLNVDRLDGAVLFAFPVSRMLREFVDQVGILRVEVHPGARHGAVPSAFSIFVS